MGFSNKDYNTMGVGERIIMLCKALFIIFAIDNSYAASQDFESFIFEIQNVIHISSSDATAFSGREKSLFSCVRLCLNVASPSFYFIENNSTCLCLNGHENITGNIVELETGIIYGIRKEETVSTTNIQKEKEKAKTINERPEGLDCLALYEKGYTEDDLYTIQPSSSASTLTWCDMSNGGWTVIQRREDGSEDFNRNWEEYRNGFGNRTGEFWLGLENIYHLTINSSSLYVYMETFENDNMSPSSAFAEYSSFKINNESDKYRLILSGYTGSCGDSLSYHNNCQFSTKDQDNDQWNKDCAAEFNSAWWYKSCHVAHPNGLYLDGADTEFGLGINWNSCWGLHYSLKKIVMKIKRNS